MLLAGMMPKLSKTHAVAIECQMSEPTKFIVRCCELRKLRMRANHTDFLPSADCATVAIIEQTATGEGRILCQAAAFTTGRDCHDRLKTGPFSMWPFRIQEKGW